MTDLGPAGWQRRSAALVVLAVALIGLLRIGNEFVIDDDRLIQHNESFDDLSRVPSILGVRSEFLVGKSESAAPVDSYRPLSVISLMVNTAISRTTTNFHLTNLALHLTVTWLVFLIASAAVGGRYPLAAAVATALFGFHPVMSEAHVWIDGRSDPMAALFLGGAIYLLLRDSRPDGPARPHLFAGLLVLFACFCKEVVLMFAPVLFLLATGIGRDGQLTGSRIKAGVIRILPVAVAMLFYLIARMWVLRGMSAGGNSGLFRHIEYLPALVMDGIRALLVPTQVAMRTIADDYRVIETGPLILNSLLGLAVLFIAWQQRRRAPLLFLGVVALYLALLPITLFVTLPWIGFGRYLYLPGLLLWPGALQFATSFAGHRMWQQRPKRIAAVAITGGVLLLWIGLSIMQILDYRTRESFYSAAIRDWPNGRYGYLGLGEVYATRGEYPAAVNLLEYTAIVAPPDWPSTYYLAHSQLALGNAAAARAALDRAPADPFHPHWYSYLRALLALPADSARARQEVGACLARAPAFVLCLELQKHLDCVAAGKTGCQYQLPVPPQAWDLNGDGPP